MSKETEASKAVPRGAVIDVPGAGAFLLPREFAVFTGEIDRVETRDAREPPSGILSGLAEGAAVVLSGPYRYVDAVYRYCQHFQRKLVAREEFAHVTDRAKRSAAFTAARRRRLHRMLLVARGDRLLNVEDPPETQGLQEWFDGPTGDAAFLIPVRRLQRILTDMRRAREGIHIECLGGAITIRPHVYVPADRSVPAMFTEYAGVMKGARVLDMGTGTGVLALLAAKLGAAKVVATDSSPDAVTNARENVVRLGLEDVVDVRGPADIFDSVRGETFDAIMFNAPWILGEPGTLYDAANYDPGWRVLDGFVKAAPAHLAPGGAILLQYSDVSERLGAGSIEHLRGLLPSSGLRVASERTIARTSRVLGARERVFLFEIRRAGE